MDGSDVGWYFRILLSVAGAGLIALVGGAWWLSLTGYGIGFALGMTVDHFLADYGIRAPE